MGRLSRDWGFSQEAQVVYHTVGSYHTFDFANYFHTLLIKNLKQTCALLV